MMFSGLFRRRVRGFRIVELTAFGVLLVLVLVVYLAKTFAGRERTEIAQVERDIAREQARIRLLQAEVAYLEQPERLERLSRQYLGMEPLGAKNEADADGLIEIAAREMKPATPAPVPVPVVEETAPEAAPVVEAPAVETGQ